ncbi:hypothetical protein REPUB_Repub05bG0001400 [Reevesia pubescens]
MDRGLEDFWAKLALADAEKVEVSINKAWVDDAVTDCERCLVGKLFSRHNTNTKAMRDIFMQIWELNVDLLIKENGSKTFLFQFDDIEEKERVLMDQPWSFNKFLLLL